MHFTLLEPVWLGFLVILPVLFWVIRILPPLPKRLKLPTISFLIGLSSTVQTPNKSPLWLLLLRLFTAAVLITTFAKPCLNPAAHNWGDGALFILFDTDWSGAQGWNDRLSGALQLIDEAEREQKSLILLTNTTTPDDHPPQLTAPLSAIDARHILTDLKPLPWSADWETTQKALMMLQSIKVASYYWFPSGLNTKLSTEFLNYFNSLNHSHIRLDTDTAIHVLALNQESDEETLIKVERSSVATSEHLTASLFDLKGNELATLPISFESGIPEVRMPLTSIPSELRNQITHIALSSDSSAATTVYFDQGLKRKTVGLVGPENDQQEHSLLNPGFYIDRALKPFATLKKAPLETLIKDPISLLILANQSLSLEDTQRLREWVNKGGSLILFSDGSLDLSNQTLWNELLPVHLRQGDRTMGGAVSWDTPQKIHEFAKDGPFHDLKIPDDVVIHKQVLAEPEPDLLKKTWATLEDGTPLITAHSYGKGYVILFHVGSDTASSNLPLSGLYVDILHRLLEKSNQFGHLKVTSQALSPYLTLDGFGQLEEPSNHVQSVSLADLSSLPIGPHHPPGLYGPDDNTQAINLGNFLQPPNSYHDIATEPLREVTVERDLTPYFMLAVVVLSFFDFIISLALRGLLFRMVSLTCLILVWCSPSPLFAKTDTPVELTAKTELGYIITNNATLDLRTRQGIKGLARLLQRRTSLDQIEARGVNLAEDDLAYYPFLYWPLDAGSTPLTLEEAAKVNQYINHGGFILFDTPSGETLSAVTLHELLRGLTIPHLIPLPTNHVLTRSYYRLNDFPGHYDHQTIWIDNGDNPAHDGVASILLSQNDFAGAWATSDKGEFLYPCVPDGERQRELSYRAGINIVMYALTGNYKSDQLQTEALLKKFGH